MRRALLLLALALLAGCPDAKPSSELTALLVRHGESWKNVTPPPGMSSERQDALTPRGLEQIAAVSSALRARGVKAIFSSPAGRARESAALIGAAVGVTPVVDDALASFKKDEPPDRAIRFVASKRGLGIVVFVTHSDVVAMLLGEAAHTPLAERLKTHDVPTGSLSEVAVSDTWRLVNQAR